MRELKLATSRIVFLQDIGAGDIHRHEIGRKLYAAEFE